MPRPARAPRPKTPSRGRRESSGRSTDSQLKKSIAGGSGGAAGIATALPRAGASSPGRMTRWLESERLLATLLLAPAVLLLGLFIAYPFIMGVWLSLSNTSVGNVGEFVWFRNFVKAWNDSIFRTAFGNTFFYTFWATIFKLVLGMWLALLLNRSFRGNGSCGPPCSCPSSCRPCSARSRGAGCSTRPSAHLRAHGGRPRQCHPPPGDLRVSDRHCHGPPGRGRGDLALHAARPLHRRLAAAALPPPSRGTVALGHRAEVEEVDLLLRPYHILRGGDALPLLLDVDHGHPA